MESTSSKHDDDLLQGFDSLHSTYIQHAHPHPTIIQPSHTHQTSLPLHLQVTGLGVLLRPGGGLEHLCTPSAYADSLVLCHLMPQGRRLFLMRRVFKATSTRLESARAVLVGPDLATAYLSLLQEQLGPRANFLDRKGPLAGRDQLAAAHCEQSHLVTESAHWQQ